MQQKSFSRKRSGIGTSIIGLLCNLMLSVAKITVGTLFNLVSVVADGLNNLSDMGSSAVSLISFFISEKPADKKHPYGHHRAEYVATMATGFIILLVAVELLRECIGKIIDGTSAQSSVIIYAVLGASVAVKAAMFVFYRIMAKKLSSDALKAAAIDSISDCFATFAVIIGAIITQFTGKSADGWIGIIVAAFIAWQGIKILYEQASKLIGQAVNPELTDGVGQLILSTEGVLGMHDLRIFSYGENKYFATVHISLDAQLPALDAHLILDEIETDLLEKFGVNLTAHLDPVDLKDEEGRQTQDKITAAVLNIAENIKLHDFRLIRGANTKAVFDVSIPYTVKQSDEEIRKRIENTVAEICDFTPVITVDRE